MACGGDSPSPAPPWLPSSSHSPTCPAHRHSSVLEPREAGVLLSLALPVMKKRTYSEAENQYEAFIIEQ